MANEVMEVFLIRIELEALATRLATPHLKEVDFDFLNKNGPIYQNKADYLMI